MSDTSSNCYAWVPCNQPPHTVIDASVITVRESPVNAEINPNDGTTASETKRDSLVQAAISAHSRGRVYRLELGKILCELHEELAKPGCGSFMHCVKNDIGMPYSTAQDYMREYREEARHSETRNVEDPQLPEEKDDAETAASDPNDGTLDNVDLQIQTEQQRASDARSLTENNSYLRDFNWKFRQLTLDEAEQIRKVKKAVDSRLIIKTVISLLPPETEDSPEVATEIASATVEASVATTITTENEAQEAQDEAVAAQ